MKFYFNCIGFLLCLFILAGCPVAGYPQYPNIYPEKPTLEGVTRAYDNAKNLTKKRKVLSDCLRIRDPLVINFVGNHIMNDPETMSYLLDEILWQLQFQNNLDSYKLILLAVGNLDSKNDAVSKVLTELKTKEMSRETRNVLNETILKFSN